jgi:hypothetical protein
MQVAKDNVGDSLKVQVSPEEGDGESIPSRGRALP